MENIKDSFDIVYERTEKIKEESVVQQLITQINRDYQNKNLKKNYPFQVNGKRFYAKTKIRQEKLQIKICQHDGFFSYIVDFIVELFIPS